MGMHAESAWTTSYKDCVNRKSIVQLKQQTRVNLIDWVAKSEGRGSPPFRNKKVQSCVLIREKIAHSYSTGDVQSFMR